MKPRVIFVVAAMVIGSLLAPTATGAASVKTGSTCAKLNLTNTVAGYKYTCIRAGKKLVWSKGIKQSSTLPSTSTSTSSTAPVTKSTPAFIAPDLPTSFSDLSTHLRGIIYGAWLKASKQINASNAVSNNIHFLIGPNTVLNKVDADYQIAINRVTKLYANVTQPNNVYLFYYNSTDIPWAQSQFEKYTDASYGYGNRNTAAADNCAPPACNGGMAVYTNNFDSIILMGDSNGWTNNSSGLNQGLLGHVFGHEYTHTIQLASMKPYWGNFPGWLTEGNAEWSATAAVTSTSFDEYVKFRRQIDLGSQYGSQNIYTEQRITEFLNPSQTFASGQDIGSYLNSYPHWDKYAIGMMVCEVLVTLKDQDSMMTLLHNISTGQTFAQAFQTVYGTTWAEAAPQIAHAIASEISQGITG